MIDVAGSLSMSRLYLRYADFLDIGRFISLLLKIAISDAPCVGVQNRAILFPISVHRSMTRNPERVEPSSAVVAIAGLAEHWLMVADFVSVSVKCFHRSLLQPRCVQTLRAFAIHTVANCFKRFPVQDAPWVNFQHHSEKVATVTHVLSIRYFHVYVD